MFKINHVIVSVSSILPFFRWDPSPLFYSLERVSASPTFQYIKWRWYSSNQIDYWYGEVGVEQLDIMEEYHTWNVRNGASFLVGRCQLHIKGGGKLEKWPLIRNMDR